MRITLNELYNGKATIIKNKGYLATQEYVKPFVDMMSKFTGDFSIRVKLPDQITVDSTDQDLTYNRVLVEAILPFDHSIDAHDEVIGLLFGLDIRKPVAKIYRGYLNQACTNLTVFNPSWMTIQEIKPSENIRITDVKTLMESASNFKITLDALKAKTLPRDKMTTTLGSWVDMTLRDHYYNGVQNVKISPNMPIDAYKSLLLDPESKYFIPETKDITVFDAYNAFTQQITDDEKDMINRFEKTMMVNKLLSIK